MSANPQNDPYARAVSETTSGFGQLDSEFQAKFGRPLRVTAGQNAEHKRLHPGGAWDIGGKDLKPEEGDFVTSRAPQLGLNVSDYRKAVPHTTTTGVRITGPHIHLDLDQGNDPYAQAVKDVVPKQTHVQSLQSELKAANPTTSTMKPHQVLARQFENEKARGDLSAADQTAQKLQGIHGYTVRYDTDAQGTKWPSVQAPSAPTRDMSDREAFQQVNKQFVPVVGALRQFQQAETMGQAAQQAQEDKTLDSGMPFGLDRAVRDTQAGRPGLPTVPPTVGEQLRSGIERLSGGAYSGIGAGAQGLGKLLHFKPTEELGKEMSRSGERLTRMGAAHGSDGIIGEVEGAAGHVLPLLTLPGGAVGLGTAGALQSYGEGAPLPEAVLHGAATGIGAAGGGALANKIPLKGVPGLIAKAGAATAAMEVPQVALTGRMRTPREMLPDLLLMGGLQAMHGVDPYAKAVSETRAAVDRPQARLIPQDEPVEVPEGQTSTKVSGVGTFVHDPSVSHAEIRAAVREGRTDELLKSPAKSGPIPSNEFISSADRGLSAEAEGAGLPAARPSTPIATESQDILARIEAAKQQWQAKQDEQAKGQEVEPQVSSAVPEVRGEAAKGQGEVAEAPVEARRKEPQGYLYHGTTEGALRKIAAEGLKPSAMGQVSLADKEQYAQSYADRKGGTRGVLLRVKQGDTFTPDERISAGGDYLSKHPIATSDIEIKMPNGKWVPLDSVDTSVGKPEYRAKPTELTPATRSVAEPQPTEIHHSELQPRTEEGQFDGAPENYTPKAERERSLPDTLDEANLPGGTNRTYEPISNEVSLARADQNIVTKGLDGAAEWVKGQSEPSAEHTATGLRVISELQKAGRYDEAVDVAGDLSDKLTRQGQAIQAVQVLNQLAPERALLVAERMAKKYKTRLDAKVITEKAATAQAHDARLKFLEGEVERLATEAAKGAPKKTATTGLTGRLNERAQDALAKLQNRPLDLKGISQGAELGAVTVNPRGALEGDAELLAEYGASTLGKSMDEWKADIRKRFGEIPDAQLDTIAKRSYDIRSEERVNDLAERMASGDTQTKRSAGAEIGQSIRDAEKEARRTEIAANKAKRQAVTQAADTAARTARIQEGIRLDAEKEDARQKLANARREGVEAKRAGDRIERERIATQKDEARKAAQWTAPFKVAADAARTAKTDQPMNLDDATAVAADIIAPKTPQQSVARGLNAAQFYRDIEAQTGVDRKTAKEAFKRAYQRVDDARMAAREVARIHAATGGQAGSLTDAQLQSVLAQREAAQRDANRSRQDLASEFQKLQMTTGQRIVHNFVKGSRQVLLSGITTVEKLGAFGAVEQVMRPARDLVGAGLKRLPGVKTVASQAPREGSGFNARAQAAGVAKYLRTTVETFTPGKSEVRDYVKTGHSDIDVKYGKADSLPPEATELFGRLHGALKLPAKLAEFETSMRMRLEHAINQGLDPTDPMVITTAMEGAYVDANRAIMLADNMVSDFFKAGKTKWQQGGAVGKYAAMGIETLFPITKVPVNIVAETARYSPIGTLTSVGEILVRGMRGTLGELEPAQADRIMRTLKKSTLGTLLYAMAYAVPGIIQIGGYKKKGEKEEDLKIKPDTMRVFGVDIGRQWIHHPVFITMQTMATIRRLHDQYGYTDASLTAAKQNLQHVPYLEEPSKALEAFGSEDAMRNFFGTLIRSRIEPPDLQRAARIGDQPEATPGSKRAQFFGLTPEQQATRRYPKTTGEIMQMGIPGQREKVPAVSVARTIQTPTATHYLSDKQYDELRKTTSDSVNEAMKTARTKLADLTPAQRQAASKYIAGQIEAKERDRLKLRLDKEYADSTAGDNAFDRIHKPLDEIITDAREKVKEGKFDRKPRVIQQ